MKRRTLGSRGSRAFHARRAGGPLPHRTWNRWGAYGADQPERFHAALCIARRRGDPLSLPAWITFLAVIFVFPLVAALLPSVLAVGTKRRQRLSPAVTAPFMADAVFLVAVAALLPDTFGADYLWVPGLVVVGAPERDYVVNVTEPYYDTAILVGYFALLGYVAALAWTIVAIILTRRPRVRPPNSAAAT